MHRKIVFYAKKKYIILRENLSASLCRCVDAYACDNDDYRLFELNFHFFAPEKMISFRSYDNVLKYIL